MLDIQRGCREKRRTLASMEGMTWCAATAFSKTAETPATNIAGVVLYSKPPMPWTICT